jgi:hypothetical protein
MIVDRDLRDLRDLRERRPPVRGKFRPIGLLAVESRDVRAGGGILVRCQTCGRTWRGCWLRP